MTKEVKLILTKLKICSEDNGAYICDTEHCKILLDYINNLQKKYAIMKENAETLAKRIDKAIEYCNENCWGYAGIDEEGIDKLLDILQYGRGEEGDDKE